MKRIEFREVIPEEWDRHCQRIGIVSARHAHGYLDYLAKSYAADNASVILLDDKDVPIAVCPLLLEPMSGGGRSLSAGGSPIPLPAIRRGLGASARRRDVSAVFAYVHAFCRDHDARRALFVRHPLGAFTADPDLDSQGLFETVAQGYQPTCHDAIHILLGMPEALILADVSKYHRKHIKLAQRNGQSVKVFDSGSPAELIADQMSRYQAAHFAAAGRATRPQASFDAMRAQVGAGRAALFVNHAGETPIAYLLCGSWGRVAFGWSQANLPDFVEEHSPRHLLEWEAIRYYRAAGFTAYEVGARFASGQVSFVADAKLANIATFKERYGGALLPEVHFERIWDRSLFDAVWAERIAAYRSDQFRQLDAVRSEQGADAAPDA